MTSIRNGALNVDVVLKLYASICAKFQISSIDIDVFRKAYRHYRYEALLRFHPERTKKKRILNRDILFFFFHIYTISAKKVISSMSRSLIEADTKEL